MTQLDPRIHAYREDLAAASLQDRVRAPRYAEGDTRQVVASAAPVRIAPRFDAPLATEALAGELLTAYEYRDGWAGCNSMATAMSATCRSIACRPWSRRTLTA